MNKNLQRFLSAQNIEVVKRNSLNLIIVGNAEKGTELLKNLLYFLVDRKTTLFLSGGKTPKDVYSKLAREQKINPGAVAMVDERYGKKMHKNSNEKMIGETGFLSYLEEKKIPFYPILRFHPKGVVSDIVRDYNREIKHLLEHFSKSIAIMGIGEDGHTAGLPPGISNFKFPRPTSPAIEFAGGRAISNNEYLVVGVDNFPGEFRERITLTFKALSEMDLLIVLAFGKGKKKALRKMFEEGFLEEIPARFYTKSEIAKKTILITDQKV